MDPITLGAALLAAATGAGEALGGQIWEGVVFLVRRPVQGRGDRAGSGEAELAALQVAPSDQAKAVALAEVLLARAETDPEFKQALVQWWEQAAPELGPAGSVSITIIGVGGQVQSERVDVQFTGDQEGDQVTGVEIRGLGGDTRGD
jgi:hypothetical protein